MPELQKVLYSMKLTLDNSLNPAKHSIPNSGLLVRFFLQLTKFYVQLLVFGYDFDDRSHAAVFFHQLISLDHFISF